MLFGIAQTKIFYFIFNFLISAKKMFLILKFYSKLSNCSVIFKFNSTNIG